MKALSFELEKVETPSVREQILGLLSQVDKVLIVKIVKPLGMEVPKDNEKPINHEGQADDLDTKQKPAIVNQSIEKPDTKTPLDPKTIATREIAFLCADGVNAASVDNMKNALKQAGAEAVIIAPNLGTITTEEGSEITVDQRFAIASSVLFDGVFVPGGKGILALKNLKEVKEFLTDSYKHCKFIAGEGEGSDIIMLIERKNDKVNKDSGILLSEKLADENLAGAFVHALGDDRYWERKENL